MNLLVVRVCGTPRSCVKRRPLREALGHDQRWTIPLIHGFWQQRSLALFGRTLTLTLLARRYDSIVDLSCWPDSSRNGVASRLNSKHSAGRRPCP